MKKNILSVILLFGICLCFTACDETSAIYPNRKLQETVDTGTPSDAASDTGGTEEPQNIVYKAFKDSIEAFTPGGTYETKYSLFDIDGNGTPELIYNVEQGKYQIYAFDGKILMHSGNFNSKYGVFLYDGMLFATTGGTGYLVHAKISLDENFKIFDIGYPYMTRESMAPDSTEASYTYNQGTITEDEYNTISNSMVEMETYPLSDLSYLKTFFEEE